MAAKLCKDCISVKVCKYSISIKNAINTLDANIRHPSDPPPFVNNAKINIDLKALKEHALKITGKHCAHFKRAE